MFRIDKITWKDLPGLAKLYETLSGMPSDLNKMQVVFSNFDKNPHYWLLGAYNEENILVGSILGLLCYDLVWQCQPVMFMENMIVAKEFQKQGAGKALLEKLEAIARQNDCLFLEFCSSSFREEAHAFYEAAGYKKNFVKGYRKFFTDTKIPGINS